MKVFFDTFTRLRHTYHSITFTFQPSIVNTRKKKNTTTLRYLDGGYRRRRPSLDNVQLVLETGPHNGSIRPRTAVQSYLGILSGSTDASKKRLSNKEEPRKHIDSQKGQQKPPSHCRQYHHTSRRFHNTVVNTRFHNTSA